MCTAIGHVRFTPNRDRESRHLPRAMSALLPKADTCGALAYVRYGSKADLVAAAAILEARYREALRPATEGSSTPPVVTAISPTRRTTAADQEARRRRCVVQQSGSVGYLPWCVPPVPV